MRDELVSGFRQACGLLGGAADGGASGCTVDSLVRFIESYTRFSMVVCSEDFASGGCAPVDVVEEFDGTLVEGVVKALVERRSEGRRIAASCDASSDKGDVSGSGVGHEGSNTSHSLECDQRGVPVRSGISHGLSEKQSGSVRMGAVNEPAASTDSSVPEWRRKGCLPGETKLDRNRRWRLERKDRKIRKQGHGPRVTDESRVGDEPKGFFSACDESVRKELRDSRAALLIEKNKRDLLLAQRDNRRLQSNSELVREVLRDARLKDQVVKATGKLDAHVGGWAETVVTNSSEAIINEAASRKGSSLPSLESLSSSVADSSSYALRVRKTAYEKAMSDLEDAYGVTIIYDEEYQDEKFRIRQEFEDVVYTPEQRCNRNLVKQLMGELDEKSRRELLLATKHYNLDLALFD